MLISEVIELSGKCNEMFRQKVKKKRTFTIEMGRHCKFLMGMPSEAYCYKMK